MGKANDSPQATDTDSKFEPPCQCVKCLLQYRAPKEQTSVLFSYQEHRDEDQMLKLIRVYRDSIMENATFLRYHVLTFGDVILRRWRRHGKYDERKILLKKVDPTIHPINTPLVETATLTVNKKMEERNKYRAAYLLPYLNLESLCSNWGNLVNLLHHRATSPPHCWVIYDNSQIQSAWWLGMIKEASAHGCVCLHGSDYGSWKSFDSEEVHCGYAYGAPRGLLILEAQQHLLRFLRHFVEHTLPDFIEDTSIAYSAMGYVSAELTEVEGPGCHKWKAAINIRPELPKEKPWVSLGSNYAKAPFSNPPKFDIEPILEIAKNNASEAHDELWLLQTEPEYFYRCARHYEERWYRNVATIPGYKFPITDLYGNLAFGLTIKALERARDWQWLVEQCQLVKTIFQDHSSELDPKNRLPLRCNNIITNFRKVLCTMMKQQKGQFLWMLQESNRFRAMWKLTPLRDPTFSSSSHGFELRDSSALYAKDRIGWCFYELGKNPAVPSTFPIDVILQHLDDSIGNCSTEQLEDIDQDLYKQAADIAALERMYTLLDYLRPNFYLQTEEEAWEDFPSFSQTQTWHIMFRMLFGPRIECTGSPDLLDSIMPLKQFRMPKGPKNEEWLKRSDKARQALRDVWKAARGDYQHMLELRSVEQCHIDPQLEQMKQGESFEHLRHLESERQSVVERLEARKLRAQSASTQGNLLPRATFFETASERFIPQPPREKVKTRPDSDLSLPNLDPRHSPLSDLQGSTPRVLYKLRSATILNVIQLLFPESDDNPSKKCIDWVEFVEAMSGLHFTAESRGGSVFTFKGYIKVAGPGAPSEPCLRSINVHKPHPKPEMGPILLQSIGKRLHKSFGWERQHFKLKSK